MSAQFTSETEALSALHASEEQGLAFFFDRYYAPLALYASRITGDTALGEEIASEVFVRLWHKRQGIDKKRGPLKPLLYRIAHDLSIDALRQRVATRQKQKGYGYTLESAVLSTVEVSYQHLVEGETYHRLHIALGALSPRSRQVFLLFYYRGKSLKQIAALLGVSVNTVKTLKLRALQQLRTVKLKPFVLLLLWMSSMVS